MICYSLTDKGVGFAGGVYARGIKSIEDSLIIGIHKITKNMPLADGDLQTVMMNSMVTSFGSVTTKDLQTAKLLVDSLISRGILRKEERVNANL